MKKYIISTYRIVSGVYTTLFSIMVLGVTSICIIDLIKFYNGNPWAQKDPGWLYNGIFSVAPTLSLISICICIVPGIIVFKVTRNKTDLIPIIASIITVVFIWLDSLILYLPWGVGKL